MHCGMSGMSTELSMCIVYIATYIIIIMQMIIIHASSGVRIVIQ